jgi:hypothetical protein
MTEQWLIFFLSTLVCIGVITVAYQTYTISKLNVPAQWKESINLFKKLVRWKNRRIRKR